MAYRPPSKVDRIWCNAPLITALLSFMACKSPVERAIGPIPEHVPATIALNAEVSGETLDGPDDVDEFTFVATDDGVYDVYFQSANRVHVDVLSNSRIVDSATNQPGDTSLFAYHTGLIQVSQAAPYVIRVTAADSSDAVDVGPYRLFLYAVDRRPEHIDSSVTPGDTVFGEEVDLPRDIDEFTFNGAAGTEYNVFFQAQSGLTGTYLVAQVEDADGTLLAQATSVGTDTSLNQVSGRFALRTTGKPRVRVLAAYPADQSNAGRYRFFLYRINRQPEASRTVFPLGDSLSIEAIDLPGDVDEFRVTVPDTSGANLVLQQDSTSPGRYLLASLVSSTDQVVAETRTLGPGSYGLSGRVRLTAGQYVLRVDGNGEVPPLVPPFELLRGRYRVWLYRLHSSPEVVSGTLTIPDTISGESVDPPGDEDVFRFNGSRREHINIALQGMADPTANGGFRASLMLGNSLLALVASPTSSPSLGSQQTLRFDLPVTGQYTIAVTGGSTPEQRDERGAYRLGVIRVPTAPEHGSPALVPGDSVITESIDSIGDWDQFTVTATPGAELGLLFGSSATIYYPWILAFNATNGDSLAGTVGQNRRFAGPFRVPNTGQFSIAVFERPNAGGLRECYDDTCGDVFRLTGPYQFSVVQINRGPETAAGSYAIGDTIRGEAIDPSGDIDEFSAQAASGQTLTPFIRLTADPVNGGGLTLEIIDPATGTALVGTGVQFISASPTFASLPPFTVPASGNFIVRVRGSGLFGDEVATAPYEFYIKP